jgi:2-methylcitrate dehydratase PrpD
MPDAINPILDYAVSAKFADLPLHVVRITEQFLLDTMGLMWAGAKAPGAAETIAQLTEWGGKPEARILATGVGVPAPYAALANSVAAHALDFDDTHERGDMHAYSVVVPAAFAAAERMGKVTGKDLLTALVVGVDVAYRIGLGIRVYRGWHPTATCGVFGATVAAGLLLKLNRTQLHNATGIAYSLSSGNFQCILDGSLTKRLQPAFAARAAVEAAVLASRGITGAKDVLEGKFGFFPLYEAGDYRPEHLREKLGVWFEGEAASMKPYPSCRFCHGAIDAILEMRREHDLKPFDVVSMKVELPHEAYDYVGGPYTPGDSPQVSAQFNIAYNVAAALTRGRFGLDELSDASVLSPELGSLAALVETVPTDEEYPFGPQAVSVNMRDGRLLSRRVETMSGHPDKPLDRSQLLAKAAECLAFGGASSSTLDRLVTWIDGLKSAPDALAGLPVSEAAR